MIASSINTPHVDWFALSPSLALIGASALCLFVAALVPDWLRRAFAATIAFIGFAVAGGFAIALFNHSPNAQTLIADSMSRDRLAAVAQLILAATGAVVVFVSWGERRRTGVAQYYALLTD